MTINIINIYKFNNLGNMHLWEICRTWFHVYFRLRHKLHSLCVIKMLFGLMRFYCIDNKYNTIKNIFQIK